MKNAVSVQEAEDFLMYLRRVSRVINEVRSKELSSFDLTLRQSTVIHLIHDLGEKATSAEIAKWLLRKRHSIHEQLRRLEVTGMVKLIDKQGSKNRKVAILTEKGYAAYKESSQRKLIQNILICLSKKERTIVIESLSKILAKASEEFGVDDDFFMYLKSLY